MEDLWSTICAPKLVATSKGYPSVVLDIGLTSLTQHNPPIPSAFPFPLALPMVRHKVTVILEVLRGKETPMAFLCRKIILSQVTNTVSILQLLKKHILEILPIDFPYYLSYRLDSIQVKCVTGKFTQIWDMIYVVWDQWIWGCAPSQVIERLVFLSESVFFFLVSQLFLSTLQWPHVYPPQN